MNTEEKAEAQERADRDGFWKEAIERFLEYLIMLISPALHERVDWTKKPEFISKELQDTILGPNGHNSPLFVDELVKLFLKDGSVTFILLHIEVQGEGGEDISWRMALYGALILGHYHQMPVAVAILTAPRPKGEIVGCYKSELFGTKLTYEYNVFDVMTQDDEELLVSDNPFSLIIYAAKKEASFKYLKGMDREQAKFRYLREITRLLAGKGWNENDRRDLLTLVASLINLKDKELQKQYVADLKEMKGEKGMAMTFIEQYFRDEGEAFGVERGRSEGRREANFETARRLREMGMADPDIHRATSLSLEELRAL